MPAYADVVFDVGPEKLLVLLVIALIVLGPDRLPGLARDAARMLRTLRDLSWDTRAQLTDELGPELRGLADLNLRTFLHRALFEDDPPAEDTSAGRPPSFGQTTAEPGPPVDAAPHDPETR